MVLEAIVDLVPLHEALTTADDELEKLLDAVGRKLAVLHSSQRELKGRTSRSPWVLGILEGKTPPALDPDPEIAALASEIAGEPLLKTVLSEMLDAWRPEVPIHGDVKFDNILVGRARDNEAIRVVFIDWELADLGLAEWDLAGITEGLITPALQQTDPQLAIGEVVHATPVLQAYTTEVATARYPDNRLLLIATVVRLIQATIQLHAMRHAQPECQEMAVRVFDGAMYLAQEITGGKPQPEWIRPRPS
jgi:hypothetical protein